MKRTRSITPQTFTLAVMVSMIFTAMLLTAGPELAAQETPDAPDAEEQDRFYNRDSLLAGATVHAFIGDLGELSPFFGYGLKWDTFSDFQGVDGLSGKTIWEFISLGLTVAYVQGLSDFPLEVEGATAGAGKTTAEAGSAFQLSILATMMYLPGIIHPYLGIGFAWTEVGADELPGEIILPMLDVNLGVRLDLGETFFIDVSNYANWGRDSALEREEAQDVFFFTTFVGLGVNVL